MMPGYGNLSFLEGIRLVLAVAGAAASIWALMHVSDGAMAFARPIRSRMKQRRRWQMIGNLVIFLTLGAQTVSAGLVPDPAVITSAGVAVSYAMIVVLATLLVMTLMFSIGWASVEEIVGATPLQPDAEERLEEATSAGRDAIHIARGQLTIISLTFEAVLAEPDISPERRAEVMAALESVVAVDEYLGQLQNDLRALDPNWGSAP